MLIIPLHASLDIIKLYFIYIIPNIPTFVSITVIYSKVEATKTLKNNEDTSFTIVSVQLVKRIF